MIPTAVGFTALMLVLVVWSEANRPRLRRLFKILASSGFLVVALSAGAYDSPYGRWILVGLACSWLGDLLLTVDARSGFLGGLLAFALAHVAYGIGFTVRGLAVGWLLGAAIPVVVLGVAVVRWLGPHLEPTLRAPVLAYVVVISVMVIAAFGTVGADPDWRIAVGAVAFSLSDIAVARNRFVAPGFVNRAWGLPLYYLGQVLLAVSPS